MHSVPWCVVEAPLSGFACWMGARANGLIERDGAVLGVHGVRNGKEPFEIHADVVVGADGRQSAVRRLGGFSHEYREHAFDVIWFVVDPPPDWTKTLYFSLGKVPLLLLPKYPGQIQAGLLLPVDAWRGWRQVGVAAVSSRLRGLSPLFASFAGGLQDFTPFFPLPAVIALVRDWAGDGLLLIGDAAHTMSPAGAIGVNVALATAAVAAREVRGPDVRTLHRLRRAAAAARPGVPLHRLSADHAPHRDDSIEASGPRGCGADLVHTEWGGPWRESGLRRCSISSGRSRPSSSSATRSNRWSARRPTTTAI